MKTEEKILKYFNKIFMYMFLGLLVSGLTGYYVSINEEILVGVIKYFTLLLILEILVVIFFSTLINKIDAFVAKILFFLYAVLNGITFSVIFVAYTLGSIILVFIAASILFLILALYGYITKKDLTNFGTILFVGLISAIIVSIINIFLGSSLIELFLSIIIIVIFLGLTAYDIQKLRSLYYNSDEEIQNKMAIYGALSLYLDFINIFIRLISLFGKRK